MAEEKQMTAAEEAWDLAKTVLIAVGIALILRVIFFQPFNIPSGSMKPNLLVGDFLFVSKPAYGYSRASLVYPLTRLPIEGRLFGSAPERGDVVVFKNRRDGNKDYIKRVIGLPGDQINIINGVVYVNKTPIQKDFIENVTGYCSSDPSLAGRPAPAYRETMDNGVSYTVIECFGDKGSLDFKGPYEVPADHYFMMGDNRDKSQDSRVLRSVGYVHKDDIVGKAERLFFSVDGSDAKLWQVWKWPFAIRYDRILDPVE